VPAADLPADRPTDAIALSDRQPVVPADRLVAEMVPPPRFMGARFATYLPDPAQPSQSEAVRILEGFSATLGRSGGAGVARKRWFGRPAAPAPSAPGGIYLDGGYGVGKTHLLASLWHAAPAPRPSAPSWS